MKTFIILSSLLAIADLAIAGQIVVQPGTDKLQAALDAAASSASTKVIELAAGTHRITKTVRLRSQHSGIHVRGGRDAVAVRRRRAHDASMRRRLRGRGLGAQRRRSRVSGPLGD